jgi:flagellin-like protein
MFNKKGLSPVVATVALVLITVAAAVFLAGFVIPLVKNSLNQGTECLGYEDYFKFYEEFDYNCYRIINDSTRNYTLTAVSIEADTVPQEKLENIKALRIQFIGSGGDDPIEVVNGGDADPNHFRMLNNSTALSIPEKGGVKTYVLNSSMKFKTVEVYPVLKNDRICEQTDKISIEDVLCEPDVPLKV